MRMKFVGIPQGLTPKVQMREEKSRLLLGVEGVLDPVDVIVAVGLALD